MTDAGAVLGPTGVRLVFGMHVRIGIVAPYRELADLCREVCAGLSENAEIRLGDLAEGAAVAAEMERSGADVIISRGGTALAIQRTVDIPVVPIEVSPLDIMRALVEARELGSVIGVVGFQNVVYSVEEIAWILGLTLVPIEIKAEAEAESRVERAVREGVDVIVGDAISAKATSSLGIPSVLVRSGKEAIRRAVDQAKHIAEVRKRERERSQELAAILDFAHEGILGVGSGGEIRVINPVAERVLGMKAKEAIGRHISDVIPEVSVERLATSAKAEVGELSKVGPNIIVSTRVPIHVNGHFAGAVITFQDVTRIQHLEEKVRKELHSKGYVAKYGFADIGTRSPRMRDLLERSRKYAAVDSTVLITGETGTGKEMLAQSIHNESRRRDFPFVAINCAAMPSSLLESELFGYEEGAFTGARRGGKQGLFEQAHKGSIFLDEIGEMPVQLQARLLRVLEEREVMRVGGDRVIPVDVRVIAATNVELRNAIAEGRFREDLYYRLDKLALHIPPLRARTRDISMLAEEFLTHSSKALGTPCKRLAPDALKLLESHSWPGNVRELKNVIERIVIGVDSRVVDAQAVLDLIDVGEAIVHPTQIEEGKTRSPSRLADLEREAIRDALVATGGNRGAAARMLGISRATLWRRLRDEASQ